MAGDWGRVSQWVVKEECLAGIERGAKRGGDVINDVGGNACERISDVERVVLGTGGNCGFGDVGAGGSGL